MHTYWQVHLFLLHLNLIIFMDIKMWGIENERILEPHTLLSCLKATNKCFVTILGGAAC